MSSSFIFYLYNSSHTSSQFVRCNYDVRSARPLATQPDFTGFYFVIRQANGFFWINLDFIELLICSLATKNCAPANWIGMQALLSSTLAKVYTQVHAHSRFKFPFLCFHPSTDLLNLAGCDLAGSFAPDLI
jgi:hypothetical protein